MKYLFSGKTLNEYFLKFAEGKLQSKTAEESYEETDPEMGHEPLCDQPHGVVDRVGLHQEEIEVEGHVEEVGHEGDLGDGEPEPPGEELVHDPPVPPAAGEGDPHETETPGSSAAGVE